MRDMGSSMCSRRKGFLQSAFLLLTVAAFVYGAIMYSELHGKTRRAESLAQKYQQQQESLAAQLQVVYEHRSRLEKSLQRERGDHKKTKEDLLLYKLEVQENLNKDKQEALNRYNSLNAQHQILKSQHVELKQQYTDIHEQHATLQDTHDQALQRHQEELGQVQQDKDTEISALHQSMYKLREEGKQLRKAHQDVHNQLQETQQNHNNLLDEHEQLKETLREHQSHLAKAQVQVREYQQLKETLNKMPSLMQGAQGARPAETGRQLAAGETAHRDRQPEELLVSQRQARIERDRLIQQQPLQPDNQIQPQENQLLQRPQAAGGQQTPIGRVKSHYETQLEQQRVAKEREEAALRLAEQQQQIYQQRLVQQEARQAALRQQVAAQQQEESLREARVRQQAIHEHAAHGKEGEEKPEKNENNAAAANEHNPQDSVANEQEAARAHLAPLKPELQQHQPLIPAPSAARVEHHRDDRAEHQNYQQQQHQQQHRLQQEEEEEEPEEEEDQNPANDPNNQGEDEFEAEQALQERAQRVAAGARGVAADGHDAPARFDDGANGEARHAGLAPGGGGGDGRDEFEDAERALQQRVRSDAGRHGAGAVILGPEAAGAGDADGIQPDEDDQLVVAGKPDQQEENEQEYQEEQDGDRRVEGPRDDTGRDVGPDDAVEVAEHYDHGNEEEEEDDDGDGQEHRAGHAAAANAANGNAADVGRHAGRGADGGADEEEETAYEEEEEDRAGRHPGGGRRGAEM